MPWSSSCLPRGIPLAEIKKCIPKRWRKNVNQSDESTVSSNLTALKDFATEGHLSKALSIYSEIKLCTLASTPICVIVQSLSSLLMCSTNLGALPEGKQLHGHIISLGLEGHLTLVPKLVTFYAAFNRLADARFITETSNILHPLPWNILISSYVKRGCNEEAVLAFQQMVNKGIRPDRFSYSCVFKACGEQLDLDLGKAIHKSLEGTFSEHDLFVLNALVSMYGKCGELDIARKIFDKIINKDPVTWNSMISLYASKGMWTEAFDLFESMNSDCRELNHITCNAIAGGFLRTGNFCGALTFLSKMRHSGLHLDSVSVIIGLGASSHLSAPRFGKEIHGLAVRSYSYCFDKVRNALITMYARCKDLAHAHTVFRLVEDKSIISWNSIICGCRLWDKTDEAFFLFREMLLSGIQPSYVTFASILPMCARLADLQHAKEFHCYIMRHNGFEDHLLLWNALVDTYARSGKIGMAKRLFCLLKRKDVVTYTSLIGGYGRQGEGKEAFKLFEEMTRFHIKPDHVTMVAILSACSHSGLVDLGEKLFKKMECVYDITPRLEHFACMANLFGKAGSFDKAIKVITTMPFAPTPAIWASLIVACRIHGKVEIGEWAAEQLLDLRPENLEYYVLIANMFAAAGSWSKIAKVRTFMRDLEARKDGGLAWVNIGAEFSQSLPQNMTTNSQANKIYVMTDECWNSSQDSSTEEETFYSRVCCV